MGKKHTEIRCVSFDCENNDTSGNCEVADEITIGYEGRCNNYKDMNQDTPDEGEKEVK